jgi:hypothetical protein
MEEIVRIAEIAYTFKDSKSNESSQIAPDSKFVAKPTQKKSFQKTAPVKEPDREKLYSIYTL